MILFALILINFHYAMTNGVTGTPEGARLLPSVTITNGDPDCLCPSGNCWGMNESCTPPNAITNLTLSCVTDQSESSQLEVWHSFDLVHWNIYALVTGSSYVVPVSSPSEYFRVRSTCPGFISAWNTK